MLTQLETICNDLDYAFLYGEAEALNKAIDGVLEETTLYFVGYGAGELRVDEQGYIDTFYRFGIWLLVPSDGADERPDVRRERFETLLPQARTVLRKLQPDYETQNITFESSPVFESANRWISGILLSGLARERYTNESICL